jgi:hypothetical protein
MLSTAGLVPVAQEFCGAGVPGLCGSEFSPVSAECPSTMMPRSGCDAERVPLGGLAAAALVAVDAGPELDAHEAAVSTARPTARTAQTRERTAVVLARLARSRRIRCPAGLSRTRRVPGRWMTPAHQRLAVWLTKGHAPHRVIIPARRLLIAVSPSWAHRPLGPDIKKRNPAATRGAPWIWPRVSPALRAAVPGLTRVSTR